MPPPYTSEHDPFAALYFDDHYDRIDSSSERDLMMARQIGFNWDRRNIRPWYAPPYSPAETLTLERWRTQVLSLIDERIAFVNGPRTTDTPADTAGPPGSPPAHEAAQTEHRALCVPEILDNILGYTDERTQYAAWNVSWRWRASSRSVIKTFWGVPLTAPVEFEQRIDPAIPRRRPTPDEISRFEAELPRLARQWLGRLPDLHLPALLTESNQLSDDTVRILQNIKQPFAPMSTPPRRPDCLWFDFTQFEMNPYLPIIFEQRMSVRRGKCEVALHRSSQGCSFLLNGSLSSSFLHTVGQTFFTQPPFRVLGLFFYNPKATPPTTEEEISPVDHYSHRSYHNFEFLERIRDDGGIRVGQVLQALRRHSQHAVTTWNAQTPPLKEMVRTSHWIDNIWEVPGYPTICISLDNTNMRGWFDMAHIMITSTDRGRSELTRKQTCQQSSR